MWSSFCSFPSVFLFSPDNLVISALLLGFLLPKYLIFSLFFGRIANWGSHPALIFFFPFSFQAVTFFFQWSFVEWAFWWGHGRVVSAFLTPTNQSTLFALPAKSFSFYGLACFRIRRHTFFISAPLIPISFRSQASALFFHHSFMVFPPLSQPLTRALCFHGYLFFRPPIDILGDFFSPPFSLFSSPCRGTPPSAMWVYNGSSR